MCMWKQCEVVMTSILLLCVFSLNIQHCDIVTVLFSSFLLLGVYLDDYYYTLPVFN